MNARRAWKTFGVIGSGTMGAQIAAHLANAGFEVFLFDLQEAGLNKADAALVRLRKMEPAAFAMPALSQYVHARNLEEDLPDLKKCDLVIEAIPEVLSLKQALYQKVIPFLGEQALLASNTSGLSIHALAQHLPEAVQPRFLGMHFFNPPRYLSLVELIAHDKTDPALLDQVESFLTSYLGKDVVRAQDTPGFIANRVGVFGLLMSLHYAQELGLGFEVVDQLTGPLIGRPKSATVRTLDLVGLDVLGHVVSTLYRELSDDPWHRFYVLPEWMRGLIQEGRLGAKTRAGIYKKTPEALMVWDPALKHDRVADQKADVNFVAALKKEGLVKMWKSLAVDPSPCAQFLYRLFSDLFTYAAFHVKAIAGSTIEVDRALRFGFGWKQGIFELWQAIGVDAMPVKFPFQYSQLPVHLSLPVYERQKMPHSPQVVFQNEGVDVWEHEDLLVLSFKTKLGTISNAVLEGIHQAQSLAEDRYTGLIIWQRKEEHFSAGADLMGLAEQYMLGGKEALQATLSQFQQTVLGLRACRVPVVAAVRGYVLGGGCELAMHTHQVVAALETYMGLVETGVGLIPGACGSKEMVQRASQSAAPAETLLRYFKQIGMAEAAKSAYEAREMGYLRETDRIVMNPNELFYVAIQSVRALAAQPFVPPRSAPIVVQGRPLYGNMLAMVENLKVGQFISEFDAHIAERLAYVMTGGAIDPQPVDPALLLQLEREVFLGLVEMPQTQARVEHLLKTGKPLRN